MFVGEIKKLQADKLKPQEQITLEPYERDHAVVVGVYRCVLHHCGWEICVQFVRLVGSHTACEFACSFTNVAVLDRNRMLFCHVF